MSSNIENCNLICGQGQVKFKPFDVFKNIDIDINADVDMDDSLPPPIKCTINIELIFIIIIVLILLKKCCCGRYYYNQCYY
ncbi:hypothetical protein [Hathewaya massiliensis]|uniref:hypothetical protein n=1 Tax=Hathewaya massiliensis TaxID=1964382 RepID=UPI001157FDB4|nr:hypothetical protein [Hathewaya massiliensis]